MIITKVAHLYTGILTLSIKRPTEFFRFKFNLQELFIYQNTLFLSKTYVVKISIYESILTKT